MLMISIVCLCTRVCDLKICTSLHSLCMQIPKCQYTTSLQSPDVLHVLHRSGKLLAICCATQIAIMLCNAAHGESHTGDSVEICTVHMTLARSAKKFIAADLAAVWQKSKRRLCDRFRLLP